MSSLVPIKFKRAQSKRAEQARLLMPVTHALKEFYSFCSTSLFFVRVRCGAYGTFCYGISSNVKNSTDAFKELHLKLTMEAMWVAATQYDFALCFLCCFFTPRQECGPLQSIVDRCNAIYAAAIRGTRCTAFTYDGKCGYLKQAAGPNKYREGWTKYTRT